MSREIIAAIDIGSSKVTTVIAKVNKDKNKFDVIGHASTTSKGLSRGMVVDVEEAHDAVKKSILAAQRVAGVKVSSLTVGISGQHIESVTSASSISLSKYPREIKAFDKNKIQELIESRIVGMDRSIIHRVAYNYRIDDGSVMSNPVGMIGRKLEADVHIVTGIINAVESLIKCIQGMRISVNGIITESFASALSTLSDTEKRMGALVIDMGAGTTDICVVRNNNLIFAAVIPIGGDHITNDIATILNSDLKTAEYLKRNINSMLETSDQDSVEVSGLHSNGSKKVRLSYLKAIIDARSEEIVRYVVEELKASNSLPLIRSSAVLSGGTSRVCGMREFVEEELRITTRIGVPLVDDSFPEELKGPESSVVFGLLEYSLMNRGEDTKSIGSLIKTMKVKVTKFFKNWRKK